MVGIQGLGTKIQFWGTRNGNIEFRVVITVVSAPGARDADFHPKTYTKLDIWWNMLDYE